MLTSLSRRLATLIVALIVAIPLVSLSGTASATLLPLGKKVTTQSANANVTCVLTVLGYNPYTNQIKATLRGNINPRTLTQYATNATSFVYCAATGNGALDAGFASGSHLSNSATANFQKTVYLDYDTSYELCAYGSVISRDGTTTSTPYQCVS